MLLGLSSPLKHTSPEEWASKMHSLGCGSVVFPVNYLADKQTIQDYADCARKYGLVIAEVGVWNNVLSPKQDEREKALEYAIGQLKMADEIGATCCVNIAGTPVNGKWDGGYRENFSKETWDKIVQTTQQIIDSAKPERTFYSIESMPWMYPTGPDEYLQLMREVDRKQFAAHLDIVNMINTPERYFFNSKFLEECFTKLEGRICSCHLKDIYLREEYTFQLVETKCGNGTLDIEKFAELADNECKNIPMIIEHLSTDEEYLESLSYVQKRLKL